jgi:hypothetical protein
MDMAGCMKIASDWKFFLAARMSVRRRQSQCAC